MWACKARQVLKIQGLLPLAFRVVHVTFAVIKHLSPRRSESIFLATF